MENQNNRTDTMRAEVREKAVKLGVTLVDLNGEHFSLAPDEVQLNEMSTAVPLGNTGYRFYELMPNGDERKFAECHERFGIAYFK